MTASKAGLWWDLQPTTDGASNGPAVVLLAPGARPVRYFTPSWMDRVSSATGYPVVRIDLPGQGGSPSTSGPLVFDHVVEALHSTLKEIGHDSFHIVGVGISGALALAVAEQDPTTVASISAISTSAYVADPALPGADEMLVASISIRQDTSTPEAVFGTLLNHERRLGGLDDPDEVQAWVDWGVDPSERYRRLFLTTRIDDDRLAAITTPTAVIHGTDDPLIPPAHGEHLAAALGNAQLALIPGMGHGLTTGHETTIAEHVSTHVAGSATT